VRILSRRDQLRRSMTFKDKMEKRRTADSEEAVEKLATREAF
jgi:hypothetical protein